MDSAPRWRGRLTLAERSAASGIGSHIQAQPIAAPSLASALTPPTPTPTTTTTGAGAGAKGMSVGSGAGLPRHCWVVDPPGVGAGRFPGLLIEWQHRDAAGWAGYVVFAVPEGRDVVSVRMWVPAAHLHPA